MVTHSSILDGKIRGQRSLVQIVHGVTKSKTRLSMHVSQTSVLVYLSLSVCLSIYLSIYWTSFPGVLSVLRLLH